ncbi:MAG: hypothetical protein UV78_C0001G0021 [Parcubacteria group bacterium GW2011_GWA2_43_17]|nr:MAG: hypothetical protein UV78_C0001G0021 [Parcubacteria group bacterium GW2011_GWA2_43_17]OHB45261.1 MAG: hypothetical protein A2Y13_03725 [Planctomycetes bacterium GWC2_45_44]HBR20564.1 hypothetical protein [Phycisphaerales bacterium]
MKSKFFVVVLLLALFTAESYCGNERVFDDPNDGYSMPGLFQPRDFETVSTTFTNGTPLSRAQNYYINKVEQALHNQVKWVRWSFVRKLSSSEIPGLSFLYESRVSPAKYTLNVFNNGNVAIALSNNPGEPNSVVVINPKEEKTIEFESCTPGSNSVIAGSAATLTLNAVNITSEKDYDLYMRNLQVSYPLADGIRVLQIKQPSKILAGQPVSFEVKIDGKISARVMDIELRHEPWVILRIRLTQNELDKLQKDNICEIKRDVPWYLSSGKATIGLVANGYRVDGFEGQVDIINKGSYELPKTERRNYNGKPTVFLNGKPFTWSGYATYDYRPGAVSEFGASGANVFFIAVGAGRHIHQKAAPTWLGGDSYDFGQIEQRVSTALQANPDARLIMRVSLCLPPFWLQEHKDSKVLIRTDSGDIEWEETGSAAASLASQSWRLQQQKVLRDLIQYCKKQPWADRIISFFPTGAVTEEWFSWGCNDGQYADYSIANENAFQEWCRNKSYSFPRIPDPSIRKKPGYDLFDNTYEGRWSAAYTRFYTELTAETIEYFAKTIKDETENRSLVGVLYGYTTQLAGEARQSTSANFGLREIIDSKYVDFVTGIPLHTFRSLTGEGYDTYTSATASILAAGKFYNNEDDLFSWLHNYHWYTEYDHADPRAGAISMHRRVVANDCIHGAPRQWFSLFTTWHHDRQLQSEFSEQIRIHKKSLEFDRTDTEEVAFVVDDTSFAWLPPETKYTLYTHHYLLGALGRTGAPVGVWLLSDMDKLPERIKVVVVAHCAAALPTDIEKLKKLIEKGGRTIVVVGTPGLINPVTQQRDSSAPAKLLGLPVLIEDEPKTGKAHVVKTNQIVCNLASSKWGSAELVRPRAYIDGQGWLAYEDGRTAGAERPLANGGRLIWCGVPPHLDTDFLRSWLIEAGVHCYGPCQTFVYASRELVAITSVFDTDKEIELQWPKDVSVKDMFDGWSGTGRKMSCPFKAGQTRLFTVSTP